MNWSLTSSYTTYQLDFLSGNQIAINYTMNASSKIDIYLVNQSIFKIYKEPPVGWSFAHPSSNSIQSDKLTNHSRMYISLRIHDSYFFIFEAHSSNITTISFEINYRIEM